MIDWEGLLKFSLKYSDGTKQSNFQQMAHENKKWLEEALAHFSNSEIKRIQDILHQLDTNQNYWQNQQQILSLMEQLQDLLDSLDKGGILYKLNGHIVMLKIIFYSKLDTIRIIALQILSSANQNDSMIQTDSINSGALQLTQLILKQTNIKVVEAMMGTISSIIRGQNLQAKRIFIKIKGLEMIKTLIKGQSILASQRLLSKIFTLLNDLLFYDERLHYSYNDLTSFTNTNNIKLTAEDLSKKSQKGSLYYDVNEKYLKNNQIQQNKCFRGYIKRYLNQGQGKQINQIYKKWKIKQQQCNKN